MTNDINRETPLWCANIEAHAPHSERNQFDGVNYCTGRPEQAYTPREALSDDEREAFATLLDDMHGEYVTEGGCDFQPWRNGWRPGDHATVNSDIVDPLIAALRRPVQGEPTPFNGKWVCGKCAREIARGDDDGQIPEHHRTCPKRAQGEPTEHYHLWTGNHLCRVGQGEPTDAQVKAAQDSLLSCIGWVRESYVRAALRAAFQEGENRG